LQFIWHYIDVVGKGVTSMAHSVDLWKIWDKTIIKDSTTPKTRRYTTL